MTMYAAIVVYLRKKEDGKKKIDLLVEHFSRKEDAIEYVDGAERAMKNEESKEFKFGRVYEVEAVL